MGGPPTRAAFTYLGRAFPALTGQWFPSVAAFCRAAGVSAKIVYNRVHEGWPLIKALDTPKIEVSQSAGAIYLVTRLATGERYVGLTLVSIRYRWRQHVRGAARRGSPLARAIDEDGPDGFTIEPVEEGIAAADLADRERHWVEQLGTLLPKGLNKHPGGAMGGGGRRSIEYEGERFSSVALASAELAKRYELTESAAHQRLRNGKDLEKPLKVSRTRGRGVAGTFLWGRWRSMRNNLASELGPEWQDWDRFASDLADLRRCDRLVRKDRALPWGPSNFEIHRGSYVQHPKVGTTHWQRWRMMLQRAEKAGDRGVVEEWREFDRFEADIGPTYKPGAVMIPLDWERPWGPSNFAWGSQSDLSRLVGYHGRKRIVHGEHRSATYRRWASMKNDARRADADIAEEWLSFPTFRDAVGAGIEAGLLLLRPDRTRPFGPGNFRLVTRQELHASPTNLSHGRSGTALHRRWSALCSRARKSGLGLDARWNEFEAFAADVGEDRPGSDLERIDASRPYGPQNFLWVDRAKRRADVESRRAAKRAAAQVKREVQAVTVGGVTYRGLYALAEAYGLPSGTVCLRVRQGMTPEEAVTTPDRNMANAKPVRLDDRNFPSMKSALRYVEQRYGIRPNTMQLRLKSGLSLEEAARKPLRAHARPFAR
jgi:hypothetical protein